MKIEEREVVYCKKGEEVFDIVSGCTKLEYHRALGDGDAHYVDCYLSDGSIVRVFRPDVVIFAKEEQKK